MAPPQDDPVVQQVARHLLANDDFIFTTHLTPDGDGLGSQLALLRVLRRMEKKVRVINCSSVPEDLRFMTRAGEIITYMKDRHNVEILTAGTIIAFDLGGSTRLGRMEKVVRDSAATKILVDHHVYQDELFDMQLVDVKSSSSAEITYEIIRAIGGDVDLEVAEPLYVGILQDTGSFNYNSTSRRTHELAGEFLDAGVNPHRVWKKLNCQKPYGRVVLMGRNISRIELFADGKVAAVRVDLDYLKKHGGEARDAFEVVNHLLTIAGVEVGVLALQIGSRRIKFSLRSAGRHDVHAIAKDYGGGGHRYASGCTVDDMDMDTGYTTMVQRVEALVAAAT